MIPKYQHLADELRKQIRADDFGSTGRLPTEAALCKRYGLSRQTVREALSVLKEEGLIRCRQGSGTYVTGLYPDAASNRIAILLPSEDDYIYARLRNALLRPLSREGFSVSFYVTGHSVARERVILQSLTELPPRGLIVEAVKNLLPNPNLDLYEKLWTAQCTTLFLHGAYENFPSRPLVADDDIGGGLLLARYFIAQKHTRLAGIFRCDTRSGAARYFGVARACAEASLPLPDENIRWYTAGELLGLQKKQDTGFLADFVRQNLGSCSAVICQDDEIAYWLVKELARAGHHVPTDVSVAGFDNSYLCEFSEPALTSLARRPADPAACAVSRLLAAIRNEPQTLPLFHWELILRGSTASLS